jgi:tetratricopeptide (TPR) repeat protein
LTRIFIVGGSAAFAWPYTEEYGFSGYLRRALDRKAPGKFEVINAAGMSFGSHRVLDVLKDVVQFDPDLIIVYSGNNEYVERNVLPGVKKAPETMKGLSSLLGRLNLYRAVRLGIYKISPEVFQQQLKQDITDIRANPDVERGALGRSADIDREVLVNYRKNITAMRDLLVSHGIKGIFSTVPVNVGGWLPTVADPQFVNEQDLKRWLELYERKENAFSRGDISLEGRLLEEMIKITPNDAGMIFNYGKVLWNQGKLKSSYRELVRAKDLDLRPMRALSSFNDVINSTVDEKSGIYLADLDGVVKNNFMNGVAEELFLDYCHFTENGHKLAAINLINVIQRAKETNLPLKQVVEEISSDDKALSKENYVRGHELYAQAIAFQNNGSFDQAIEKYKQVLTLLGDFTSAYSNLGNIYSKQGKFELSKNMYHRAIEADPKNIEALTALGYLYFNENRLNMAEELFFRAQKENPISR